MHLPPHADQSDWLQDSADPQDRDPWVCRLVGSTSTATTSASVFAEQDRPAIQPDVSPLPFPKAGGRSETRINTALTPAEVSGVNLGLPSPAVSCRMLHVRRNSSDARRLFRPVLDGRCPSERRTSFAAGSRWIVGAMIRTTAGRQRRRRLCRAARPQGHECGKHHLAEMAGDPGGRQQHPLGGAVQHGQRRQYRARKVTSLAGPPAGQRFSGFHTNPSGPRGLSGLEPGEFTNESRSVRSTAQALVSVSWIDRYRSTALSTMVGDKVQQKGRVLVSTSVTHPGSITMSTVVPDSGTALFPPTSSSAATALRRIAPDTLLKTFEDLDQHAPM